MCIADYGRSFQDGRVEKPWKLEPLSRLNQDVKDIADFFQSKFPKQNRKFVMAHNLYFPKLFEDARLSERITNPDSVIVSARGVFAQNCVSDALGAFKEQYNLSRGEIVASESIFKKGRSDY